MVVKIGGSLTFLSVPQLIRDLAALPTARKVRVQFNVQRVDIAAIEMIRDWKTGYERAGGSVQKDDLDAIFTALGPSGRKAR